MSDCLQTGKASRCKITNTKGNSVFYPSGVGKYHTSLSVWGYG